jgi:hypothetical protein
MHDGRRLVQAPDKRTNAIPGSLRSRQVSAVTVIPRDDHGGLPSACLENGCGNA